jgi:hypothetical protein
MLRVLIVFGIIGIFRRKASSSLFSGGMNRIDTAVILFAMLSALAPVLLWQQWATVVYQLGELYTTFGVYLLLRFLIRDREDIKRTIRAFAYVTGVVALIMLYEQAKGWNPYALLGGARASFFSSVLERDGRFRAMGCFAQPILAGTFGAVLLPLFVGLWWIDRKSRGRAIVGIIAATVMIITSNSSTPVTAYLAGVLALSLWPLRRHMRFIRWGILLSLVSLHLVMKAPVWHLISRVDISGGSSSYHRYQLIDQFIRHFWDWWLVGTKSNADWGWWMWDAANQYVAVGESSGLIPFILFLAIIVLSFKYLGKARHIAASREEALFLWSLGSALFAHVVGFFGISYFDQTIIAWYTLLAMISTAVSIAHKKEANWLRLGRDPEIVISPATLAPQLTTNVMPAIDLIRHDC